ncbi:mitochondrial dicarboxylate/tricarboxylate transporter DTC-like isoform X2 [Rhododendron vialii]|uniref:mitochondrial dicarboxylate/tricarboxylate transporter DTC-like isoform X2 n=1 Tax=Rhododendron vialii TaxID=182163 RepID=UPI00265DB75A|nr:mitochondrial dicarboxylate/tricarboxylate transporter DTC-like isoform X2 [Rhododendron vialii]
MVDSGYSDDDVVVIESRETLSVMGGGEKPKISSSSYSYNSIWTDVKPFVHGGLAGLLRKSLQACFVLPFLPVLYHSKDPKIAAQVKQHIPSKQAYNAIFKRIPGVLLLEASYTSLQLGSFEILTRKVEAANNGMPPTLFQEACCGLTSGAIATYFCTPLYLAMSMKGHLYHTAAKEGVLALWKGVHPHANAIIAWNMGMLAPYNRCYNYFRESRGLSETRAIIGASAVSGFFAAACCFPIQYANAIVENMKPDGNGKSYSISLSFALKFLNSGGSMLFFTGLYKTVFQTTPRIMLLWYLFEKIRKHEESIGMSHCKKREIFTSEWK